MRYLWIPARLLFTTYGAVLVSLAAMAIILAVSLGAVEPPPVHKAGSIVKIIEGKGHGSGVHIGDGFIVTAAHVVGDAKETEIKLDDGVTRKAEVLWSNKAYDIALVRTGPDGLAVSHLSCRVPDTGEVITARGNPTILEFVDSYGRVAGGDRKFGSWQSVFVTDITTVPGMSGGGVFDADGNLVGITVGVLVAPAGMFPSLSGFGTAVPGSTVCGLMGRLA